MMWRRGARANLSSRKVHKARVFAVHFTETSFYVLLTIHRPLESLTRSG